jgi:1-acyl-sn-glycerol-3-phosphate acyltransferase
MLAAQGATARAGHVLHPSSSRHAVGMTARRRGARGRNRDAAEGGTPRTYRAVLAAVWPVLRGWGRLQVVGAEALPLTGPTLLVANHDSAWDPLVIGAAVRKQRHIRALARSDLWEHRMLGRVLDAMGQIPIDRGQGDTNAIGAAIDELRAGACIGVFPEGTVSRGRRLRARSGAGRLALAVPEAHLVCAAVTGTSDIARFPRRPRLRVCFFAPTEGSLQPGASMGEFAAQIMAEIRLRAPIPGASERTAEVGR